MNTIIKYTLLTASRDWLFVGLFMLILMAYGMSVFTGSTALVEQSQMSLAYFAGASRIIINIGLVVFVCFHVRRAFENREIESILAKPISRVQFIIGYWVGFALLTVGVIIPVLIITALLNQPDLKGLLFWGASVMCETALVVAFAMLAALIMRSVVGPVLSTFAFYLVSRLMGFFIAAFESQNSLMGAGKYGDILEAVLRAIATVIPRLDLYAKSEWLIYGVAGQEGLWIFSLQSAVFIPFLLAMAVFDFKRKQF